MRLVWLQRFRYTRTIICWHWTARRPTRGPPHRGPFAPHLVLGRMVRQRRSPHHRPPASISSISAALDEQADLGVARVGFRAEELQRPAALHQLLFLCARGWRVACGVTWRGVWRVLRA